VAQVSSDQTCQSPKQQHHSSDINMNTMAQQIKGKNIFEKSKLMNKKTQ